MSKKIVGICACPVGIAHTYMAADAIEAAAKKLGYKSKVETQGSTGIEEKLSEKFDEMQKDGTMEIIVSKYLSNAYKYLEVDSLE